MAVVLPEERPAAASVTNVPRSLAAAAGPLPAGWLLGVSTFGWPLVVAGLLKATYDLLLLRMFRSVKPSGEMEPASPAGATGSAAAGAPPTPPRAGPGASA
jgi:hypothetical protein